ncbi:MAG: polysaccharide deacetylase, partial [Alphaproteobacteria bacterium]|nr:polysaccharide deacetylase [Alphaproteobacteria bacterium]
MAPIAPVPGRTEVCITVDVEFSIAGSLTHPDRYRPVSEAPVYGRIRGREHGLGFLLDTLADHGLTASFFVECLNTHYFGDAPMGQVVERLLAAGQDVQMHLHPEWLYFRDPRWAETVGTMMPRPNGSCAGRSLDELVAFMRLGQA